MPRADDGVATHHPAIEWSAGVRAHRRDRVDQSVMSHDGDAHAFGGDTDRFAVDELVDAAHGVPGVVGHCRHLGVDAGPLREHEVAAQVTACAHRTEAGEAEQCAADVVTAASRPPRRDLERERRAIRSHVRGADTTRSPGGVLPVGDPGRSGGQRCEDPDGHQATGRMPAGAPRERVHERCGRPAADREIGQQRMQAMTEGRPREHALHRVTLGQSPGDGFDGARCDVEGGEILQSIDDLRQAPAQLATGAQGSRPSPFWRAPRSIASS